MKHARQPPLTDTEAAWTLELPEELRRSLIDAARSTRPEECCGLLFSPAKAVGPPVRVISAVAPASNEARGDRRRGFVISPAAYRRAEGAAHAREEVVSGFYHSHPNGTALPSEQDVTGAWPWFTYVVVACSQGRPAVVAAYRFDDRKERLVPVEVAPHRAPSPDPDGPVP